MEIGWKSSILPKTHEKKCKSDRNSFTSDSSSSSSSSNNCSDSDRSPKTKHRKSKEERRIEKRLKKEKRKLEKTKRKEMKKMKKEKRKEEKKLKKLVKSKVDDEDTDYSVPIDLMYTKAKAPETKEEYEARQNQIRRVVDPVTGRTRLVKGDGEILEEIVSRDRHKEINKKATQGDGNFFQGNTIGWKEPK